MNLSLVTIFYLPFVFFVFLASPVGATILQYEGASESSSSSSLPSDFPLRNRIDLSLEQQAKITTKKTIAKPLPPFDRQILLVQTVSKVDKVFKWAVNSCSYVFSETPTLLQEYYGIANFVDTGSNNLPPTIWNFTDPLTLSVVPYTAKLEALSFKVPLNQVVQIVLQKSRSYANTSLPHFWRLHGHKFLDFGNGK